MRAAKKKSNPEAAEERCEKAFTFSEQDGEGQRGKGVREKERDYIGVECIVSSVEEEEF